MLDDDQGDQAMALRLKRARINAGYASASEFARNVSVNITTYHHHENGRRGIGNDYAQLYARALNVATATLLYGEDLHGTSSVPIVGVIGPGGKVLPMHNNLDSLDHVVFDTRDLDLPPTDTVRDAVASPSRRALALPDFQQLQALIITGDALYPAYSNNDVVLHRRLIRDPNTLRKLHGRECVVELKSGARLLRMVTMQGDGLATLCAYASPPMINVEIVAAAPVELVVRNQGWHTD